MAMGPGRGRISSGIVFRDVIHYSPKSAVAGQKGARGRGEKRAPDDRRRKLRAGLAGNCKLNRCRTEAGRGEIAVEEVCFPDFSGGLHWGGQSAGWYYAIP